MRRKDAFSWWYACQAARRIESSIKATVPFSDPIFTSNGLICRVLQNSNKIESNVLGGP